LNPSGDRVDIESQAMEFVSELISNFAESNEFASLICTDKAQRKAEPAAST
jgi:hypothetical protein